MELHCHYDDDDFCHHRINFGAEGKLSCSVTPVTFWVAIALWARLSEGARFRSPIAHISTPLEVFLLRYDKHLSYPLFNLPKTHFPAWKCVASCSGGKSQLDKAQSTYDIRSVQTFVPTLSRNEGQLISRHSTQLMSVSMYMSAAWTTLSLLVKRFFGPRTHSAPERFLSSICG